MAIPRRASLIASALRPCQGDSSGSMGAEVAKALALPGQALEKRRGRPRLTVARMKCRHVGQHLLEPDLIGIEHRATAIAREAVAVEVGHVDIARAEGDALFEDTRAFVDEGPQAAFEHLLVAD